jgi:hypothetical protein
MKLAFLCSALLLSAHPAPPPAQETPAAAPAPVREPLEFPRAAGQLPLLVPRQERLQYEVRLQLGPVDARVGTVTLDSRTEPYRRSLLRPGSSRADGHEVGVLSARAFGSYTVYTLDHRLETRLLPQDWPCLSATSNQEGTEKRRHELLLGQRGGQPGGSFRNDTKHGAPRGTRVWSPPIDVVAPAGALDSLSAILLVRSMRKTGSPREVFVMLDKENPWEVELSFGAGEVLELPAGRFEAIPVLLSTKPWNPPGSDAPAAAPEFAGPFGIRGEIQLWVEANSGVPLRIQGSLPAGPINIDIDIRLEQHAGTPAGFTPAAPVRADDEDSDPTEAGQSAP